MKEFQERLSSAWTLAHGAPLNADAMQRGQSSSRARHALRVVPGATLAKFGLRSGNGRRILGRFLAPKDQCRFVVVYCPSELDGGAGAEEALPLCLEALPLGIAIFAIDVTPTKHSRCYLEDVECAVGALRDGHLPGLANITNCCIGLWGRSAGAIAALQYAQKDPSIAALVSDSAYSDLTSLAPVLTPLANFCQMLPGSTLLKPVEVAKSCFIPGFFLHGAEDQLIPTEAAKDLRSNYGGEAQLLLMPKCSHDSPRPSAAIARAVLFLARAFSLENPAVNQLDLYLTKLATTAAMDSKMERKAEELLGSEDEQHRQWGFFLKAVNACGYHDKVFHRNRVMGQRSHGRNQLHIHYAILLQLPRIDCEACIAWASESDKSDELSKGMVHFMVIAPTSLRISRAVIRREDAQHRVLVQDLMLKELNVIPREKPYCMLLTLSDFGRIDLKIGNYDALQFPGSKDCGALKVPKLWTAALGNSAPPAFKDELLPAKLIPVAAPGAVADLEPGHLVPAAHGDSLEDASSLEDLPASAAELAMQMQKVQTNDQSMQQKEESTFVMEKKRLSSEMSNVAPSELSAGTFLSKAPDSLALSLSTVSDADEDDSISSQSTELVRSQTWPDVKEPQLPEGGRRHSWAANDLLPFIGFPGGLGG